MLLYMVIGKSKIVHLTPAFDFHFLIDFYDIQSAQLAALSNLKASLRSHSHLKKSHMK